MLSEDCAKVCQWLLMLVTADTDSISKKSSVDV